MGGFQGQATDFDIHAREIIRLRAKLNEILAHHTKAPLSKLEQDTERDYFMSADEACEYGIIDKVLASHAAIDERSEEHTSELQSRTYLVCRLLLEKKKFDRLQTI